ncbi:hypothetical protein [Streptomyces sp. NPDC006463]|uniref:hypothetical protein n=1 Tax=Streptomyces sp. NPDC006463 TaxID=3364746 RepID=UPI00369F5893
MSRSARILTAAAFAVLLVGGAAQAASADSGWGFAPVDSGWGAAPADAARNPAPADSGWGSAQR